MHFILKLQKSLYPAFNVKTLNIIEIRDYRKGMGNIRAGTLIKFTKLLIANVSPGILQ